MLPRWASRDTSWIERYAPAAYSEKQHEDLDRLTEDWLDQLERQVIPGKAARELGTLEKIWLNGHKTA
jgi:hypothetical protein